MRTKFKGRREATLSLRSWSHSSVNMSCACTGVPMGVPVHSGTLPPLEVSPAAALVAQGACRLARALICLLGHQGGPTPGAGSPAERRCQAAEGGVRGCVGCAVLAEALAAQPRLTTTARRGAGPRAPSLWVCPHIVAPAFTPLVQSPSPVEIPGCLCAQLPMSLSGPLSPRRENDGRSVPRAAPHATGCSPLRVTCRLRLPQLVPPAGLQGDVCLSVCPRGGAGCERVCACTCVCAHGLLSLWCVGGTWWAPGSREL